MTSSSTYTTTAGVRRTPLDTNTRFGRPAGLGTEHGTNRSPVPNYITHLFLLVNVVAMLVCSTLVIIRKYSDYAVAGLGAVVITQALGYGLIFDINFFLRNLSVIGGLLMVLSDSWVRKTKAFAGLPQLDEKDRKMYFQLAGRVLLIFLFVGFVFSGQWTPWRVVVSLVGALACVMVLVGFKAKFSATLLVLILSVFNVLVNNFWTVSLISWRLGACQAIPILTSTSSTSTTPTRTLRSTTSSRSSPSSAASSSSSTADRASSLSTRRRRCTKNAPQRAVQDINGPEERDPKFMQGGRGEGKKRRGRRSKGA